MKNKTYIIVIAILVILAAGFAIASQYGAKSMPIVSPAQPSAPASSTPPVTTVPPATTTPPTTGSGQEPSQEHSARVITEADSNTTITVKVGTPIEVMLGSDLDWTISWSDPSLLAPIPTFAVLPAGTQSFSGAVKPGTTTLTGQGRPICKAGEACPQFIEEFTATLVITK